MTMKMSFSCFALCRHGKWKLEIISTFKDSDNYIKRKVLPRNMSYVKYRGLDRFDCFSMMPNYVFLGGPDIEHKRDIGQIGG